jgi:transketolase
MSSPEKKVCIKEMRDAFFDTVYEIAKEDPKIVFLTADMGAWSLNSFQADFPEKFLNMGISEQNMVSVAAGMALNGQQVFVYAIAPFLALRALEQVKLDICAMNLPVTIIGSGPGFAYGSDGITHHAIEDITVMGSLPKIHIFNPSDPESASQTARLAYDLRGPSYVRIDKGQRPVLYNPDDNFQAGLMEVSQGKDLAILATGIMVHTAIKIRDNLKKNGIKAAVIDIFRLKPVNNSLKETLAKFNKIITIEEHIIHGGLGSIISDILHSSCNTVKFRQFGIQNFNHLDCGSREWLWKKYSLDHKSIEDELMQWF